MRYTPGSSLGLKQKKSYLFRGIRREMVLRWWAGFRQVIMRKGGSRCGGGHKQKEKVETAHRGWSRWESEERCGCTFNLLFNKHSFRTYFARFWNIEILKRLEGCQSRSRGLRKAHKVWGIWDETTRTSGNMPGGQGLRECSRQKEQLLVIHFSQQIGTKHLSDTRNQRASGLQWWAKHTHFCAHTEQCVQGTISTIFPRS